MAVLDLQGMETPLPQTGGHGSSDSGHSCPSHLSIALCNGTSDLSVVACH